MVSEWVMQHSESLLKVICSKELKKKDVLLKRKQNKNRGHKWHFSKLHKYQGEGTPARVALLMLIVKMLRERNTQPSEIAPFRRDAAPVKVLFWSSLLMLLTIIWSVSDF